MLCNPQHLCMYVNIFRRLFGGGGSADAATAIDDHGNDDEPFIQYRRGVWPGPPNFDPN